MLILFGGGATMRLTARGILINKKTGNILFIKYLDRHSKSTMEFTDGFWVLPGGSVEKHETFQEALKREIYEETGISNIIVKNCVLSRIEHGELRNSEQNFYYERYYLVETEEVKISTINLTNEESEVIKEYKWWSINELKQTKDIVFPLSLKSYVDVALSNPNYSIDITDSDKILKYGL